MPDEHKSLHVMISGRVQGVGYRAWCRHTATGLGLSGWVRNTPNGEVEAVFSGRAEVVDRMLINCAEGPGWARVEEVRIVSEAAPVVGSFDIRR